MLIILLVSQFRGGVGRQWYPITIEHKSHTIPFEVILAKDDNTRRKGLSIVSSLERNQGMLFLFPIEGVHRFWMKGMRFPIDILWFNANGELCDIKERAKPEDYPTTYTPECISSYVLEIPARSVKAFHLEKGDTINLSHIPSDVLNAG